MEFIPRDGRNAHKKALNGADNKSENVTEALRTVFWVGRLLGFPFNTRIHILSVRSAWLGLFLVSGTAITVLTMYDCIKSGRGPLPILGGIVFYFMANAYQFFFLHLALVTWGRLETAWLAVERRMSWLPQAHLSTRITANTVSYIIIGLCEHSFSILDNLRRVREKCPNSTLSTLELYYKTHYVAIFGLTNYAVWKGTLTSVVILYLTILWTFTDVFIIAVSITLATRFNQLKLALVQAKGKVMNERYWKEIREIFLDLSNLTEQVDTTFSPLILLSLGNNIFMFSTMLLNSLSVKVNTDYVQTVYYVLCLSLVALRLGGVCVSAANIYDNSKAILPVLSLIPEKSYGLEVQRLMLHVWYKSNELTGYQFFSLTWSTILKIVGSLVTYEIVLVQFDLLNTEESARRPKADCPAL